MDIWATTETETFVENYKHPYQLGASLVAQMIKHLPTSQETWVQSLGRKDPL